MSEVDNLLLLHLASRVDTYTRTKEGTWPRTAPVAARRLIATSPHIPATTVRLRPCHQSTTHPSFMQLPCWEPQLARMHDSRSPRAHPAAGSWMHGGCMAVAGGLAALSIHHPSSAPRWAHHSGWSLGLLPAVAASLAHRPPGQPPCSTCFYSPAESDGAMEWRLHATATHAPPRTIYGGVCASASLEALDGRWMYGDES